MSETIGDVLKEMLDAYPQSWQTDYVQGQSDATVAYGHRLEAAVKTALERVKNTTGASYVNHPQPNVWLAALRHELGLEEAEIES